MNDRREFLKAGLLIVPPSVAFGSQANSTPEFGVIGCGSRGTWISNLFVEHTGARIVAAADAFPEAMTKFREKYPVDAKRAFVGMEAYRQLVKERLDGVIIETPTMFHPDQAMAAAEAGQNVYCAKPIATDVPGAKRFLAASKVAEQKGRSFWVDFQTRNSPAFRDAVARVHRGEIGDPVFGHIYYHAGKNVVHPVDGLTAEQAELRNWLHSKRLSGDIIVEQNIHVLDVANWYLQGHPLRAIGTCGQKARKTGDVSDHFIVTYFYPNDVKVDFSSVQFSLGYGDLCMRLYGSNGVCDAHYNGLLRITGPNAWKATDKDDTFVGGAIQNIKDFVTAVRSGKAINNGAESVQSNLTGILGRVAAARERMVTWEDLMKMDKSYDGKNDV